jgi:hypothetical protein
MNKQFETLDLDLLSTVSGGQNSENVEVAVPGAGPVISKGGTRSDWGYCADTVKGMGGSISDIANVCGKPNGAASPDPAFQTQPVAQ